MIRTTRRGWLVVGASALAGVVATAACTTAGDPSASQLDSGPSGDATLEADAAPAGPDSGLPNLQPDASVEEAGTDDGGSPDASLDSTTTPPVDAAPGCKKPSANDPCGLDPQCGCPAFETCEVDGGAGTICSTAGSALAGHGCATTASCAAGLTCFNGVCRPYCTNTGDAGCEAKLPEGGTCAAVPGDDGGPLPNFDVCEFRCNLEDPNACGQTGDLYGGCLPNDDGTTDCIGVGLSQLGDNCTYLNDCLPGLVCVGQCVHWCRVGHSPSDCGDAEACQAFGDPLTVYGVQYGYCP